jgi:hypothetical protein
VAGWPGGQSWIDSSSLLTRMSLPKVIFQNKALQVAAKDNGDANEAQYRHKGGFGATMDWGAYAQHFADISDTKLAQALANHLLLVTVNERVIDAIDKKIEKSDRTNYIKNMTLALMALPEYQVC